MISLAFCSSVVALATKNLRNSRNTRRCGIVRQCCGIGATQTGPSPAAHRQSIAYCPKTTPRRPRKATTSSDPLFTAIARRPPGLPVSASLFPERTRGTRSVRLAFGDGHRFRRLGAQANPDVLLARPCSRRRAGRPKRRTKCHEPESAWTPCMESTSTCPLPLGKNPFCDGSCDGSKASSRSTHCRRPCCVQAGASSH